MTFVGVMSLSAATSVGRSSEGRKWPKAGALGNVAEGDVRDRWGTPLHLFASTPIRSRRGGKGVEVVVEGGATAAKALGWGTWHNVGYGVVVRTWCAHGARGSGRR